MNFSWLGPLGFIKAGKNGSNTSQHTNTTYNTIYKPVPHPEKLGYIKNEKSPNDILSNLKASLNNGIRKLMKPEKMKFDLPKIKNEEDAFKYSIKREAERSFLGGIQRQFFDFVNIMFKSNFMRDMMANRQVQQLGNKKGDKNQQSNSAFNFLNPFRFF